MKRATNREGKFEERERDREREREQERKITKWERKRGNGGFFWEEEGKSAFGFHRGRERERTGGRNGEEEEVFLVLKEKIFSGLSM